MWHRIQIMQTHFNSNVGETRHHLFVTRFLYTGAFGQYANSLANLFTNSFCACRSRKRRKLLDLTVFLALLGSSGVKAAHKMMAKLTPYLPNRSSSTFSHSLWYLLSHNISPPSRTRVFLFFIPTYLCDQQLFSLYPFFALLSEEEPFC